MINNSKICGLIGLATRAGKVAFGADACLEGIEKRKVKIVIMAKDASDRTKNHFKDSCEKNRVPIYEILSIEEISACIGKDNKAVIGIKDMNFSNEITKIINGGEFIG